MYCSLNCLNRQITLDLLLLGTCRIRGTVIDKRGEESDRSNDDYKTPDVNSNDHSDDNNSHSNTENDSNVDNDRSNEDGRNMNVQQIDPDDMLEFDETYGVVPRGLLERWR